jgi:hypothetical protein
MKKKVPQFVLDTMRIRTQREWRRLKREQLRAVMEAMELLAQGSLHMPGYEDFKQARELLKGVGAKLSPKEWGA